MRKIPLEIVAISHSITQTQSYAVILGEVNGLRRLPIVIGASEAQAIAVRLEGMTPTRPLTHDLMRNFMLAFTIDLLEVVICDLQEGIFFSKLVCATEDHTIEIDSRTSDALALAVRFGCQIYTYEHILDAADDRMETSAGSRRKQDQAQPKRDYYDSSADSSDLKKLSLPELETLLEEVLNQEDYIRAIAIRDEIKSRKG